MHKVLKIIGIAIATLIILVGAAVAFVCYEISDTKLAQNTQSYLTDVFGTEVKLEGAKLRPLENTMAIYNFNIKDRAGVDMLHVDTLEASFDIWELLQNRICVHGFNLAGATGVGYKVRKDTAANYQFAIDAVHFVGDKLKNKKKNNKKHRHELFVDLRDIRIARTSAKWDVLSADTLNTADHKQLDLNHLWVHNMGMRVTLHGGGAPGSFVGRLYYLNVTERNSCTAVAIRDIRFNGKRRTTSLGELDFKYQDKHLHIDDIKADITAKNGVDVNHLSVKDIFFENGIGVKPIPYSPMRGHFDAKHVKLNVTLDASATCLTADSVAMRINRISGIEHNSGLYLDSVSLSMNTNRDKGLLSDVHVFSGKNRVSIGKIFFNLPRYGAKKRPFTFATTTITAHAMLKELAYAFTPSLSQFTTPLRLTTTAKGDNKRINFSDIHVFTPDQRLQLYADGYFNLPQHKGERLSMAFDVKKLTAVRGIKDQIIRHFMLDDKGMNFIRDLGDVTYRGSAVLPYRRQMFKGLLTTRWGSFNVDVKLNSDTYYMTGSLSTHDFHLGGYLGNNNLGDVSLVADVKMDIVSKRMARILHRKRGKIPAGTIKGRALEASYKGIKIKNVDFDIVSDAETAHGTLGATGKVMDLSCDFSFNDADIKHSLKVKPHIEMHNFVKDLAPVKWLKKIFSKKKKKTEEEKEGK